MAATPSRKLKTRNADKGTHRGGYFGRCSRKEDGPGAKLCSGTPVRVHTRGVDIGRRGREDIGEAGILNSLECSIAARLGLRHGGSRDVMFATT